MSKSKVQNEEARIDVERDGTLLIFRYVGSFDVKAVASVVAPALETHVRQEGARWRLLTDFTNARINGMSGMKAVIPEMKANRPYLERSAVLLPVSGARRMIVERALALSRRKDVRLFKTEADALQWLTQEG